MNESSNAELPEEQLPHEVVAALRDRYGPKNDVPETLDKAILADAAGHLRTISPSIPVRSGTRRRAWIAVSTGSLAAAMLLFVMWPGSLQEAPRLASENAVVGDFDDVSAAKTVAFAADDVDRNGAINILDAFALARTIDAGKADNTQWDQNGDGRTDTDDVQLIAMRAVTL